MVHFLFTYALLLYSCGCHSNHKMEKTINFLRKEKGLREILGARRTRTDGLPPKPERLITRYKLSQWKIMISIC